VTDITADCSSVSLNRPVERREDMRSLIVYDSWYGNTQQVADAIATGLGNAVRTIRVGDIELGRYLQDLDLLVVGSPTHGGVTTPVMQDFMKSLTHEEVKGVPVAAFDTRIKGRWLKVIGFASRRIAKQLQQSRGVLMLPPEGFYVEGKKGPLVKGELERATEWGRTVAKKVEETVTHSARS
jgi:flavodoxin I